MEQTTVFANKFFDFEKAKVQNLSLDQLSRTHKENNVYGQPLKGIYHYDLLQQIILMCNEAGYNADVWDLFAAQNRDRNTPGVVLLPQVEQQYGERAVEAHILRRVFANIRLSNFDNEEYTTNLAVAFHQKGIQVGFGNAVKICHNQCMLSPEHYIATYSEKGQGRGDGVDIQQIMQTVKGWLFNAEQKIIAERNMIERMKEIQVSADEMFRLIGVLTAIRVKADTSNKQIRQSVTYPLNQAQISQFTEAMIVTYDEKKAINVWDVYNAATELYKASSMDIPQLLPQNRAMVNFLKEEFPQINAF